MDLPQPHTHIPLGGEMYVTSETDESKSDGIHHFDVDAYSCNCMAWTLTKGRPKEDRSCKHLRQVLGDEHEDARVGPGVGVAKGKSKAKPKGTSKPITATTAPSSSSSSFASTSRSMSTTSAAAGAEATKRKYAEPGAQKRAITVGRGRKPSDYDDNEFDDPFGDKENFVTTAAAAAGGQAPPPAKKKKDRKGGIELLLAKKLDLADKAKKDPTGWWISEKLDGVRAYWDGESQLWSRVGNPFSAPADFIDKLPQGHELDGELFLGRDRFDETSGIVRSMNSPRWTDIRYMVFDIPSKGSEPFEARQRFLEELFPRAGPDTPTSPSAAAANPVAGSSSSKTVQNEQEGDGFIRVVEQEKCDGWDHLEEKLEQVRSLGGEGLMLRQPKSKYEHKRSNTLLKVKTFYDAEARVVSHEPGKGRLEGLVGSLVCVMEDEKTEFKVGSGFDDARRANPPPIGAIITYRFQDLTKAGVPRFPTFVGERFDVTGPKDAVLLEKNTGEEET
ncbi:hypothetical protein C6P46_004203 [Rhodotorula mucilaginosa]|uniref:SWIM-type domain-containing protein n=1 Tax=Rhodotorula mucilaginosa TaxID=5537 RepID=A0A9P6W060_RHOMI|nr:hypothetical protein C6P46_004203 [Rhodotorula mucilaginosa]